MFTYVKSHEHIDIQFTVAALFSIRIFSVFPSLRFERVLWISYHFLNCQTFYVHVLLM